MYFELFLTKIVGVNKNLGLIETREAGEGLTSDKSSTGHVSGVYIPSYRIRK